MPTTRRPLSGLKVLDLSRVLAGPLCTQYLGDMGADILKVEDTAAGDETRSWPVFRDGAGGERTSAVFMSVNRNKRSLSIDIKSPAGRDLVRELAGQVDIVVESFAPGVATRLGIDAAALRAVNPRLIHCAVSGFGSVGPMAHGKGYDLILQAFSGMLSITGDAGSPPMRSPFSPVDQATGLHALIGILAALHQRDASGVGCSVEASLFDTAAGFLGYFLHNFWETGREPAKAGVGHGQLCPYGLFPTADKDIIIGVANDSLWRKFCKLTGLEGRPEIEPFATNGQRVERRAEVEALVAEAMRRQKRTHWFEVLDAAGIPCSPVHNLGEFVSHPHTVASGMVYAYDDATFGAVHGVAQPLRFDGQRLPQYRNPPRQGQHSVELLREAGLDQARIAALVEAGVVRTGSQA